MYRRYCSPRYFLGLILLLCIVGVGMRILGDSPTTATAAGTPLKVMPLGDSITEGWIHVPGAYRIKLWQLIQQAGMSVDFVGSLKDGPADLGDLDHEGHSGFRIDELRGGIDNWLSTYKPDVVLLHIGTNDITQQYNLPAAPDRLADLVNRICQDQPGVHLVVASIVPRPGLDDSVNEFNSHIPGIVTAAKSAGCDAQFLDMNKAVSGSDMDESVTHPTRAGYDKMADAFFPVLQSIYNNAGNPTVPVVSGPTSSYVTPTLFCLGACPTISEEFQAPPDAFGGPGFNEPNTAPCNNTQPAADTGGRTHAPHNGLIRKAATAGLQGILDVVNGVAGTQLAVEGEDCTQTSLYIYTDSLQPGWGNNNWDGINNNNASPVYSGTDSVSFIGNKPWSGVRFFHDGPVDTAPYQYVHFALKSSAAGQRYGVVFYDTNNKEIPGDIIPLAQLGGDPTNTDWTVYNIPLDQVRAANRQISGFAIQDAAGTAQPTLYIDDVALVGVSGGSLPNRLNPNLNGNGEQNQPNLQGGSPVPSVGEGAGGGNPGGPSASGEQMPVGDVPGWKQVFTEDFNAGDVPIGAFPGPTYSAKWDVNYVDGTPDTAGNNSGANSRYYPSKVLSVTNGMLDWYLHSEDGVSMAAAPSPKFAPDKQWPYNSLTYGKYTVRFRSDQLKGYKTAWLLWPDSNEWADGEIDFPEGDLAETIQAYSHCVGNPSVNCFIGETGQSFSDWHTADIEWTPGHVAFTLDGQPLKGSPTDLSTPSLPMHYILQTESCLTGCPDPSTAGHLQLDWIVIYSQQ